ncbi:MAG: cysteine desulfurase [Chloroflexi bacterium]|nr:cysteine desulfurase [Chloroflexota bacterium]
MPDGSPIFLDHSTTTPLAPAVFAAMRPYYEERFAVASGQYAAARQARKDIEAAREQLAGLLGCRPAELIFTSGGTEAANLAIRGVAEASRRRGDHIITTQIEHRCVLDTCQALERQGYRVTYLPVDAAGRVDLDALDHALDARTILVAVMLANNEVGTLQPIAEVVRRVKARSRAIPVYTDAAIAGGVLDLHVDRLGVDLLSLSAHKVYGPRGVGLLYARRLVQLTPQIVGGNQERGRRAGTEYVAGIVGMAKAFELAYQDLDARRAHLQRLMQRLLDGLLERVPETVLVGPQAMEERLPHVATLCFRYIDGEAMVLNLDVQGIAAASGSACASATFDPSHVLRAMGVPKELAHGNLRLGLGIDNTDDEIDRALEIIPRVVQRLREISPLGRA